MKKTKLMVIGIDAASWAIIKPNLDHLPNFKKMMKEGQYKTLTVPNKEEILSPPIWCSMFSGKTQKEHGHKKYVFGDKLKKREDIKVDFVWDVLENRGIKTVALQVPFVMPPYNFNCQYMPVGHGASYDLVELEEDADNIFFKSLEILDKKTPQVFIVVFTALDRLQHFHWGEDIILAWYKKIDKIVGVLAQKAEKLIVVSDHGFCAVGEARVKTLPLVNNKGEQLKGDHHQDAILITRNISYNIREHQDIYRTILEEIKN